MAYLSLDVKRVATYYIESEDKEIFFADFRSSPWYGVKLGTLISL